MRGSRNKTPLRCDSTCLSWVEETEVGSCWVVQSRSGELLGRGATSRDQLLKEQDVSIIVIQNL